MPIELELSDLFQKLVTGLTGLVAAMVVGIYWDLRKRISNIEGANMKLAENTVSKEAFTRLEQDIQAAIKDIRDERRSDAHEIKESLSEIKKDITGTHRRIDEAIIRGMRNGSTQ